MEYFICANCGKKVPFRSFGTRNRNHCPHCLHSLHVDRSSGDRSSKCKGLMAPYGRFNKDDGEHMLVHKCTKCGFIRWNRIAGDDDFELFKGLNTVKDPR